MKCLYFTFVLVMLQRYIYANTAFVNFTSSIPVFNQIWYGAFSEEIRLYVSLLLAEASWITLNFRIA